MNKKIISGYIGAILIVLLMVSSATALNLTQNNSVFKKPDDKNDSFIAKQDEPELSDNPEEEKPAGIFICVLFVQTHIQLGPLCRGAIVYCRDKYNPSDVKEKTSRGLLSLAIFFGLEYGRTYEIYTPYTDGEKEVIKAKTFNFVKLCVGWG